MHPYEWGILGVKAIALLLAIGRTIVTASIDIFTGCKIANRIAGRDRVRHSPPMPNCTNWLASCPATLHRKGGCPVHQQARSWLQYRLAGAQFYPCPNSQEPNFRAKAFESDRSLTSTPNNSYGTFAKTIKTIN
jgi:hypothetical protein